MISESKVGARSTSRRFAALSLSVACALLWLPAVRGAAATTPTAGQRPSIAVLDLGGGAVGARIGNQLLAALTADEVFASVSHRQARAAARGIGYQGSLNLTLAEARDLGAAIGCDFYVTGRAETLRRSSLTRSLYYESHATLFFVSARTGRLVLWDQQRFEADVPETSETQLLKAVAARATIHYAEVLRAARAAEEPVHQPATEAEAVPEVPEASTPEASGFRSPQPYRRLRPAYTEAAARDEVEATLDVAVTLDREGAVQNVEVVRWAGYGLDESVAATVRQLHFRPAMREGTPVPVRVLLRYNFRRPAK